MDWKKEYRASDVFRRRKGSPDTPAAPAEGAEPARPELGLAGDQEGTSVWKKEIKVSDVFRRGKKQAPPDSAVSEPVTVESTGTPPAEPADGTPTESVGAGPALPAPEPAPAPEPELVATEAPVPSAAQPSAWKKEIKVSSLFRRRTKPPEEPSFVEIVAEEPTDVSAEPFEAEAPDAEPVADAPEITADQPAAELREEPVAVELVAEEPLEEPVAEDSPEEPVEAGSVSPEPVEGEFVSPEPVEGEFVAPEPVGAGPAPPVSEPGASLQESIWKKEMKVSDLFRRKKDADRPEQPESVDAGPVPPDSEPAPAGPVPTSVWKKQIRLAPRGGRGPDKPAAREKPSRRVKRERPGSDRVARSQARGAKSTGSLPDVPLVRALNLLPREEAKSRSGRRPTLAAAAVTLAGLLVIGGLGFAFMRARSNVDDRTGALEDLEAQVAAIQAPAQVAPEAGTQLAGEALARAGALTTALDGRFVWDRLLRKLSLVLPDDVWFETVASPVSAPTIDPVTGLSIPGATATITINGYAKTQADLAQLVGRLDILPELGSVQLQSGAVIERGGEDVVQFTVAATLERPSEA